MGALERARAAYGTGAYDDATIEFLFPEVKESEDERIRKFLYDFIMVCGWSEKQYPPREKCLAWLEKQKEQKPRRFKVGDIVTNGDDVYTIDHIGSDCYWLKEHDCGTIPFEYEDKWRIVEQKPAEWSEEDETMLRTIISDGSRGVALDSKQISWLKSRPHWKPSEEQMDALRIAYEIGTANESWAMSVLKSLYGDLKKL